MLVSLNLCFEKAIKSFKNVLCPFYERHMGALYSNYKESSKVVYFHIITFDLYAIQTTIQ